jgi:hypothetical protein
MPRLLPRRSGKSDVASKFDYSTDYSTDDAEFTGNSTAAGLLVAQVCLAQVFLGYLFYQLLATCLVDLAPCVLDGGL